MSKEKNVWVSFIDNVTTVNIYSISLSFPDVYDYPSNHKLGEIVDVDEETEELMRWQEQNKVSIKIINRYRMFWKLDVLPDRLWLTERDYKLPKKAEYIFMISDGYIIVNEKCASLLKKFRLGETTLTPVKIHKLFTDELWQNDTYYFLNVCERRQYMSDIQNNKHVKRLDYEINDKPVNELSVLRLKNDILEVKSEAFECDVDLWHDTSLKHSLFLSDELRNALVDANMADLWYMHSCKTK